MRFLISILKTKILVFFFFNITINILLIKIKTKFQDTGCLKSLEIFRMILEFHIGLKNRKVHFQY